MKITKKMNNMKLSHYILTGAAAGAVALCFAFMPMQQKPATKWVAPPEASKVANPVPSNDASIAAGKLLYNKNCKSCHGIKGKGDGPKSDQLDVAPGDFTKADFQKQTDGELFWKTTEGKKPMPSFKKDLDDNDRWQIINYIRTFGSK